MIEKRDITGLILAGGNGSNDGSNDGSRTDGVDPGLASHLGMPMAMHVLLRLAPQVGEVAINANRNLSAYESMGVPVWPDMAPGGAGPLAGLLTGLERCETRYLVTVPCDSLRFPDDLVQRLAHALEAGDADIAMAAERERGEPWGRPAACLLKAGLLESLLHFTQSRQHAMQAWAALHRCVVVPFDDVGTGAGANTPRGL